MKEVLKKLLEIQHELKAPKGQYNSFGKYKYRSAEDILEAVKPICYKHKCVVLLSDTVKYIGERYYVEATATIFDVETGESKEVTASAREEEAKKGMDGSQITGTASSYARKYALNGLFDIDDTKDADTDEYGNTTEHNAPVPKARPKRDALVEYCKDKGIDMNEVAKTFNLTSNATEKQFEEALKELKASEVR